MYVGYTTDLQNRLKENNAGECKYTKEHMPWKLRTCLYFDDKQRAETLEKYLKSGSGRAFAKGHF
jgi:putative endonuclease